MTMRSEQEPDGPDVKVVATPWAKAEAVAFLTRGASSRITKTPHFSVLVHPVCSGKSEPGQVALSIAKQFIAIDPSDISVCDFLVDCLLPRGTV